MFSEFHRTTIGDLLTTQADRYGERPYLTGGAEQLTYAQAEKEATRLAVRLQDMGLQPGDRLAVILPNTPAFVLTIFAAAKAGLFLVPINVRHIQEDVQTRLAQTEAKGLITFSDPALFKGKDHLQMGRDLQTVLPDLEVVLDWKAFEGMDGTLADTAVTPESPAAIMHTLGNSGQAQGALLTHGGLVRNAADIAANLACTGDDVFLGAVPFSNTFGLTATILACTIAGARLVCLPKYRPSQALQLIAEEKVTVHHGAPTMFALELNHPDFDAQACQSLRTGIMSGAHCPPTLVRRVHEEMDCRVILAYGLTEAAPSVTMTRLDDGPITATETVGRPMRDLELKVIDADGNSLPDGEIGELCVRGYNVMLRYWNEPEATARVLDDEGWLHTDDLASIDPDGPVKVMGRKDKVINRGGFKIYPGQIELVLRSFPGVAETAVVGVPDMIFGELPCACIVRRPGTTFTAEDLNAFAAERLSDFALPDRYLFFDALPRRNGVVQKDYLQERVRIRGYAWCFGKNIDTDAIIPARRCNTAVATELAQFCMEDADPEFVNKMSRGDLIVADTNFGCGSSREVAPVTIKAAGISAVIAKSFARIFFRNAINIGLPILECPEAVDGIAEGDEIEVEPATGTIRNLTNGRTFQAAPFPDFLQRIIDQGGLLAYVEERLAMDAA